MEAMKMATQEDGSYRYKYFLQGSRNYVQGKVIFESFYKVLDKLGIANYSIKELKFPKELYTNGKIIVRTSLDAPSFNYDEACALMTVMTDAGPLNIYLLADPNSEINERKQDSVNPYIKEFRLTGNFTSDIKLAGIKDYPALMSTMVDINKRTHIEMLNDRDKTYKYVWTFLKNFDVFPGVIFPEELLVSIRHLGHKKNERGEGYTLNRVNFTLADKIYRTDMCYTYVKR